MSLSPVFPYIPLHFENYKRSHMRLTVCVPPPPRYVCKWKAVTPQMREMEHAHLRNRTGKKLSSGCLHNVALKSRQRVRHGTEASKIQEQPLNQTNDQAASSWLQRPVMICRNTVIARVVQKLRTILTHCFRCSFLFTFDYLTMT